MAICVLEVTGRGDSFGFTVSNDENTLTEATRYFIITLTDGTRSITEIDKYMPKRGDTHPDIQRAFVSNVAYKVTDDVNTYEAIVQYKGSSVLVDKAAPWLQPASISFSSDSSITRAIDLAYLEFVYSTDGTGIPTYLATKDITNQKMRELVVQRGDGENTIVPVTNQPLLERPTDLPEEPAQAVAITISAALDGDMRNINFTQETFTHNYAAFSSSTSNDKKLLDCVHTVYCNTTTLYNSVPADPTTRAAYNLRPTLSSDISYFIQPFCGYIDQIKIEPLFYDSEVLRKVYAYYKVDITILVNPLTWIRKVMNTSLNTLETGTKKIGAIRVADKDTNQMEPITTPVNINPSTAAPCTIDATTGQLLSTPNDSYVLCYMTKPISNWEPLTTILNELVWESTKYFVPEEEAEAEV